MSSVGIGRLGTKFGRMAAGAGGGGAPIQFDPDAEIIFGAMVPAPNQARKIVINDLILALKAAGVWALCDILYLFAAHSEQPATLNWKAPGTFTATPVQAPPFTVDRGFSGNPGTGAYLAPGWVADVDAVQLQQNSAHISGWSLSAGPASSTERIVGTVSGSPPRFMLIPRFTGDLTVIMLNDGTESTTLSNTSMDGFFIANRNASNVRQAFRNGVVLGQDAAVSTGRSNSGLTFLRDFSNIASLQIAQGSAGAALTEPQTNAYYAALLTYMQAVGAAL